MKRSFFFFLFHFQYGLEGMYRLVSLFLSFFFFIFLLVTYNVNMLGLIKKKIPDQIDCKLLILLAYSFFLLIKSKCSFLFD